MILFFSRSITHSSFFLGLGLFCISVLHHISVDSGKDHFFGSQRTKICADNGYDFFLATGISFRFVTNMRGPLNVHI